MLSETGNADPAAKSSHGEEAQTGDPADQTSVNPAQVRCSVCSSTFRRPEHLKRHLRSHTKEKPFECNQCGRHFSRTDTLHRHELSHHAPGSEGGKDHTHRITVKTFRACFSCATARVRCSGGDPCGRCDTRSLKCQYPTERRSKAKINNEASRGLSGVTTNDIDQPLQMDAPALQQPGRFSVDGLCDPHPSPKTMMNTFSGLTEAHFENIPSDNNGSAGTINTQLHPTPSNAASVSAQLPLGVYPNGDGHHPYSEPRLFSEPMANVRAGTKSLQSEVATAPGDIDMDMVGSTSISLDFDPLLFDQSMLSTINWLPSECLTDARSEQSRSMQVSSQPPHSVLSDAYAPCITWQPTVINADHARYSNVSQPPSGYHSLGTDTASPRRSSHILNETSPYSDSVDSVKRSTDHYVDGGDARLPKYRKKHTSWSTSSADAATLTERPSSYDSVARPLGFPVLHDIHMENISKEVMQSIRPLEQSTYEEIYRNFLLLCRSDNPFFEMFNSETFPSAEACTQFIASFFDSFDTVYPIFHLPTFDPNQSHWLVTLAVMAIGCHSSGSEKIDHCTEAFHEMIRRAIFVEKEKHGPSQTSLELIQAMLLNCIGLLHSDGERAKLSALSSFRDVVTLMKRQKLLTPTRSITLSNDTANENTWEEWIKGEARRRTGYCVWLLDCTIAYYFDDRPLLSLDDGHAPLPAAENLWHAVSADAWMQLWRDSDVNESLYDAVHILYIEKRLVTGIDELGHILLIHALYHRMWEVGDYFHRPLSFWNPTAKKQSRETAIPTGSVWLPGIPSYSKWRNSACDCLDILHWTANSTVAKAAGLEHPTVLHLHVARLVLLTPFSEIRSLAISLAMKNLRWSKRHQAIEWQYIWRWTKHDQFKARLSVIHAGVTLWHIRRYSTNAFHEPVAAFLAVLTLWAYGSCLSHSPQESSPHTQGSGAESHPEPRFVHLDRPCDDELVQLFVREGHCMRGNVTGVGDICAAEGPVRILRVGSEILSSLSAWGISKRFITVLDRLADIESQHSETGQQ